LKSKKNELEDLKKGGMLKNARKIDWASKELNNTIQLLKYLKDIKSNYTQLEALIKILTEEYDEDKKKLDSNKIILEGGNYSV